jgi:hypothetical protein
MGLFDGFLKRIVGLAPQRSLQRICYDMAYTALPHCAFNDCDNLIKRFTEPGLPVGTILYISVCQALKLNIVRDDAKRFREHFGQLDDTRDYYILEYPTPPPVELSNIDMGNLPPEQIPVLAPYFSAVVRDRETKRINYFTLGQAPMGGGTTLRAVTANNENCNLGQGPEPRLDAFLAVLRKQIIIFGAN